MKLVYSPVFTDFIDPIDNVDPRRRQEVQDARMIQEDHTAMANLSPRMLHHEFDASRFPERLAMYNQNTSKWRKNGR